MDDATKRCTKCAQAKPLSQFWKQPQAIDGRHSWCAECQRAAKRERWARDRDAIAEARKAEYDELVRLGICRTCKKAAAVEGKSRCAPCREYMAAAAAKSRNRDPEGQRARSRAAYAANPERGRSYTAKWRTRPDFPERNRQASHRHRALRAAATVVPFTPDQLAQRLAYFGGLCWICGRPGEQVDHVKPLSKGGAHCLANLRPACARCNNKKRAMWPLSQEVLLRLRSL